MARDGGVCIRAHAVGERTHIYIMACFGGDADATCGLDISVQAHPVGGDADAKTGATTFLSSQNPSAGRSKWLGHLWPSMLCRRGHFATPRMASHLWLGQSCPSEARQRGRFATPRKASHLSWSSAGTPTLRTTAHCTCTTPRMASHLRLRGLDILVQAVLVDGDTAGTTPRKASHQHGSSAGTPTLRVGSVCQRGDATKGVAPEGASAGMTAVRVGSVCSEVTPRKASHQRGRRRGRRRYAGLLVGGDAASTKRTMITVQRLNSKADFVNIPPFSL